MEKIMLDVNPESNFASVHSVESDFASASFVAQVPPLGRATLPHVDFVTDARFTRQGDDLVLQKGDESVIVRDYFANEKPTLEAEGLTLSPELVSSFLETPTELYAATIGVEASATGTVSSLEGQAYAVRNGVRIELDANDAVYKGDTIETAQGGSIEMIFADGTKFALGGDARLSIDEFIYDAASNEGSQAISLLKGAFSFASGLIAQNDSDNMVVQTPIAEIGIRGTKVVGDIDPGGNSSITVIQGRVILINQGGVTELSQGFATARIETALVRPELVGIITPDEAVQRYISIFDGGSAELTNFIEAPIPEVEIADDGKNAAAEGGEVVKALEVTSLPDGTQIDTAKNLALEENLVPTENLTSAADVFVHLDRVIALIETSLERDNSADIKLVEALNNTDFKILIENDSPAPLLPQIFNGIRLTGLIEDPTGQGTISYAGAYSGTDVYLDGSGTNEGAARGHTYEGIIHIEGSNYGDYLVGNSQANVINGGDGIDTIEGGAGADTLSGGAGIDTFMGGTGADTINGGEGIDKFNYIKADLDAMDTIINIEANETLSFLGMVGATEHHFNLIGNRLYFNANGDTVFDAQEAVVEFQGYSSTMAYRIDPSGPDAFTITITDDIIV